MTVDNIIQTKPASMLSEEERNALIRNNRPFQRGLSREQVRNEYNSWNDYEKLMKTDSSYTGPVLAAEAVDRHVSNKDAQILDVGAGTGHVGINLHKLGFGNLDAVEPSNLLEQAKEKAIYNNIHNVFFGWTSESHDTIEDESYDCIVSCGAYGESHLPVDSIDESVRILRKNGICVIAMREAYLEDVEAYKDTLEPRMNYFVSEGKWKLLERSIKPGYFVGKDGIIFAFQKL